MSTALSLYVIEDSLQNLAGLRDQAEAEGDSEAIKVIDQQIAEYLTAEPAKVASYIGQMKSDDALIAACEEEIKRVKSIKKAAQARKDRMEANAIAVMQRFGIRSLSAKEHGSMRVQGNGGLEPLEIEDVNSLPEEFQLKSITMNVKAWYEIGYWLGKYQGGLDLWRTMVDILEGQPPQPSTHFIRQALKRQIQCPECKGEGDYEETVMDSDGGPLQVDRECPRCNGKGSIPAAIPGARLLPRGCQLRIE